MPRLSRARGPRCLSAALIALATLNGRAEAYPISPVPLWELVERAEVIVLADVVEARVSTDAAVEVSRIDAETAREPLGPEGMAILAVIETWKGVAGAMLTVPYPAFLLCPAPPRYLADERVLAFLARDEHGELATVGLSYGTLYPAAGEIEDFRELVGRALALQRAGGVRDADRVAWAVEAARRPGTRWHGLYELHPRGDRVHSFYDRQSRPLARHRLSTAQRSTLAASFVAAPPTDGTATMALGLLSDWKSTELDLAAASIVEALLTEDPVPWSFLDVVEVVLERFDDQAPADRLKTLRDSFLPIDPDRARALWERAREELGIPKVPAASLRDRRVRGVGGETPS